MASKMTWKIGFALTGILLFIGFGKAETEIDEPDLSEEAGKRFLEEWNRELSKLTTEATQAAWDYESNITEYNLKRQLEASAKLAKFNKEEWRQFPWQTYKDPDTRRQFKEYSFLGTAALPLEKFERLEKVIKEMEGIYGKAKICDFKNSSRCNLGLEPEITERFQQSKDPEELKYLWTEWRNSTGKQVRGLFSEYVILMNEAARLNNYSNSAAAWLKDYESDDFTDQVESLWQQVRPLYVQLHAYVRRRLREQYGEDVVSKTGPIPAHLLGNMWAQTWINTLNDTVPYPNKPSLDVTDEMIAQKYTPLKMFKVAEEFFTSLGLCEMPETFWNNSIIEKPNDGRDLICHASAWDFYDGKDFRIKQCTRVNSEDLETVHHEMGHIQYFLQYKDQPIVYKEGANPGFHEAVGDVMALSVSTPKHFQKIGLLKEVLDDQEAEINQLFGMALTKVSLLPFAYLIDLWRWGVFQGKITENDYNSKWWELREQYQGMQPPTKRTEEDFDPGAKYHIVASVPYIRYFVSFIVQFQFHRSLCIAAGEFDPENPDLKPLHKCDIYQNKKAGELLGNMLQMGSSKPWPEAMEVLTGQRKIDAEAFLQYFSTLQTWLERENARTGEYIGWEPTSSNENDDVVQYYDLEEPADSSEDDNFEYSYAELVQKNANSFESSGYREKFSPQQYTRPERSRINRLDIKNNVNLLVRTIPGVRRGNGIVKRGQSGGWLKFARRAFEGTDPVTNEPDYRYKTPEEMREEEKQHQQQSSLSKLFYTLGSSFPRPHVCEEKPYLKADSYKPIRYSSSDMIWNAELIKIKAEEMLKSYDIKEKPVSEQTTEATVMTSPAPQTAAPVTQAQPVNPPVQSIDPGWNTDKKRVAKKSYTRYHYNVRTPMWYNMVLMKKPDFIPVEDPIVSKVKLTHMMEQEVPESMLPCHNALYGDRWKTRLTPVGDRNRMTRFRQELNDPVGSYRDPPRKRRIQSRNPKKIVYRNGYGSHSDDMNNIFKIYSNCQCCCSGCSK